MVALYYLTKLKKLQNTEGKEHEQNETVPAEVCSHKRCSSKGKGGFSP